MKLTRLEQIEELVNEHNTMSMQDLCVHMQISMNTLRNDVAKLVQDGKVIKVYGGIKSNKKNSLIPYDDRLSKNSYAKATIAYKAAEFVEDGSVIYIDSGTTCVHMIEKLALNKQVTIITNNLSAINAALGHTNLTIIALPGKLEPDTCSFVSVDTVKILEKYNISACFMAAAGLSASGDVTNSSLTEYEVKKDIMKKHVKKYLLVDDTKFNKTALVTYARLSEFTHVITNSTPQADIAKLCEQFNVECSVTSNVANLGIA